MKALVTDGAGFIVDSIDKNPNHKLFHLANGKQISVNKIFELLKQSFKFEKDTEKIEAIKGEVRDILLDITLVKQELGWNPETDIEEGLKKTVEWFK